MTGTNPFVVPGQEDEPDQPLCPWQQSREHHERYYGDVGGQPEAFELFKQKLRGPDNLARAGRIVVVTGPLLSGKTSLANRCVRWVQASLDPATTRCHIYSLREVCPKRETVKDRMAKVCLRLTEKLRQLDTGSGEHLTANLATPHEVLPLFGKFHLAGDGTPDRPTPFFVILLPSLEPDTAENELDEYRAALAGVQGVLCVTENPGDVPLPEYRGEAPPISLSLRYLRNGESQVLVAGWPNTPQTGGQLPIVRESDLEKLEELLGTMNANMTSGKLLATLRKLYDEPGIGEWVADGLLFVEYSELVKAYLGKWFRQNPQGYA